MITEQLIRIIRDDLKVRSGDQILEQTLRCRLIPRYGNERDFQVTLAILIDRGILERTGSRNDRLVLLA